MNAKAKRKYEEMKVGGEEVAVSAMYGWRNWMKDDMCALGLGYKFNQGVFDEYPFSAQEQRQRRDPNEFLHWYIYERTKQPVPIRRRWSEFWHDDMDAVQLEHEWPGHNQFLQQDWHWSPAYFEHSRNCGPIRAKKHAKVLEEMRPEAWKFFRGVHVITM